MVLERFSTASGCERPPESSPIRRRRRAPPAPSRPASCAAPPAAPAYTATQTRATPAADSPASYPGQHIQELRQLIEFGAPQNRARSGDARIPASGNSRPVRARHAAKLSPASADPPGAVKRISGRINRKPDGHRHQHRQQHHQRSRRYSDVHQPANQILRLEIRTLHCRCTLQRAFRSKVP